MREDEIRKLVEEVVSAETINITNVSKQTGSDLTTARVVADGNVYRFRSIGLDFWLDPVPYPRPYRRL